jgi:hypothetical protein
LPMFHLRIQLDGDTRRRDPMYARQLSEEELVGLIESNFEEFGRHVAAGKIRL